ncbi:MAG: GNAT family N-acetyltransferase [Chloroflexales bacterium]|nr:GNAT family N-acetyltransferase [Chloroflexales bacterium]
MDAAEHGGTLVELMLVEVRGREIEAVVPLLLLAEPSEPSLRWSLNHMADTVYRTDLNSEPVGAATMRWQGDPAEILELAVATDQQGRGLGRRLVQLLADEARRRGKQQLIVGTANSSIGNIAFYQKCGLRMDHVRHDYFWYERRPLFENGIQKRDLLVFRLDLREEGSRRRR